MKFDELKPCTYDDMIDGDADINIEYYPKSDVDAAIAELKDENATLQRANDEKAERIVELQKQVDELVIVKKSAELIFMNLLDCGLIKEWYFNGKFNAVLKDDTPLLKIEALKQKLEDVQASAYAERVDAGMRERRLKRALWLARTERAKAWVLYWCARFGVESGFTKCDINGNFINTMIRDRMNLWQNVERKCLKKSKEYL